VQVYSRGLDYPGTAGVRVSVAVIDMWTLSDYEVLQELLLFFLQRIFMGPATPKVSNLFFEPTEVEKLHRPKL
jgi:hypothetical protein